MKVFRAETGEPIKWNLKPSLIKTVDELKQTFEDECGVPMSDQILMTSFGKLVKQDNLTKVLESTGKDEYIVFCYDRRYLSVDEESIEALLAAETPSLEPRVNQLDGTFILKHVQASLKNKISIQDTCQAFISLFSTFDSHSQTLTKTVTTHIHLSQQIVQAQKFQSMALNVAITNLESHRKLADVCIRSFITQAQTELDHQQHLLDAIDQDLTLLKHVRIHSSIASHKRLIDFVDIQNIQHMRHDTQDLCSYLKEHMNSLNEEIQQLKEDEDSFADGVAEKNKGLQELDELLADMLLIQQKCNYLRDKIQRDLRRVYEKISKLVPLNQLLEELSMSTKQQHQQHIESSSSSSTIKRMLDAFSHLAEIHVYDYLPKLIEYERQIREHTTHLISLKRDSISIFVRHMAVVSEFQRHVGNIQPIVDQHQLHLLQFKSRYPRGLECVRDLLFSYGALMIEKVRRKEYMVLLVNNVSGIADAFSEFSKQEEARREAFENTVMKSLPFKLGTMMNKSAAQCKVSIQGLLAEEDGIEKKDILDFISIITQVYYSQLPTKLLRHQEEQNDWLLQLLNKMMKEMDEMNNKFLKSIRENLLKQQMEDDGKKAFIMNDTSSAMVARLTPKLIVSTAIATASATASASVSASSSSDFSVVEDDYKKLVIENKELKNKLGNMEEEMNLLEQKNQEQAEEISQLRELVKTLENEKEEFESHRRSFLNELKNKDKTADFRLASAEEEFHAKV
ncbi:uncharacterized protein BX663DRAFT_480235 [Cokeromyces recurvatus]|uniref:uncharacterized protein n=1 Tax=Cokeromyces recurvatus TaxID=90255 RepID=UPI00221FB29D|nr:uncharacterized protein BX663DRAFT_480235 [Cokeromyces recurvatus]KAI7898428.1 hypothetical protein BX663DRAFT_480235 [Cokeromyces recurvatus]